MSILKLNTHCTDVKLGGSSDRMLTNFPDSISVLSEVISLLMLKWQRKLHYITLCVFCLQNGLTPLHLCAQEDKVNVAAILVKNRAEIDPATKVCLTYLFSTQQD
jgi:hypothetical protein